MSKLVPPPTVAKSGVDAKNVADAFSKENEGVEDVVLLGLRSSKDSTGLWMEESSNRLK